MLQVGDLDAKEDFVQANWRSHDQYFSHADWGYSTGNFYAMEAGETNSKKAGNHTAGFTSEFFV
jgi:hypothetical protein